MFQIMLCLGGDQRARRRVARFSRSVVALVAVVIGVGVMGVGNAFAVPPPPGLPALPSTDPPPQPAVAPPPPTSSTPSTPSTTLPPTSGPSPSTTASASLRVSQRKNLAKLTFACQSSGTARLTVRYGSHAWRSATKRYTCRQDSGKATFALSKSIARRLRQPDAKVSASLKVGDGSTLNTLTVKLGSAAYAASSTGPYWDDENAFSTCDSQANGVGTLIGTIASWVPQPEYHPDQFPGGLMWFTWRSWLLYWDGVAEKWSVLGGAQDGVGDPQPWSHPEAGWLDEGHFLVNSGWGSQHYIINPGHDVYTIVAVQTYYEDRYGQWYGGEFHFTRNFAGTLGGLSSGIWCYFP